MNPGLATWKQVALTAVGGVALGVAAGLGEGVYIGLALAIAVAAVLLTARSVSLLVGLAAGWLPIAGRLSIVQLVSLPDITVERVGVVFVCAVALLFCGSRVLSLPKNRSLRVGFGAWSIGLAFVALSAANSPQLSDAFRLVVDVYLVPTLIVVALASVPWSEREVLNVVMGAMSGAVAWVGLGFVEMATRHSPYTDTGVPFAIFPGYVRPGGPFINPAALGLVLSCLSVLALAWLLRQKQRRGVVVLMLAILVVGVAVTLTRSAWVGSLAGGLVVTGLLAPRSRVTAVVAIAGLGGVVYAAADFLGSDTILNRLSDEGTAFNRFVMYATSFNLSFRYPFTGLGIGGFRQVAAESLVGFGSVAASAGAGVLAPHNSVLLAAVESGWIAAIGLIVVFAAMMWFAAGAFWKDRDWVSAGLFALLVCYVANVLLFDAQLQVHSSIVLALLIGPLIGHAAHRSASAVSES